MNTAFGASNMYNATPEKFWNTRKLRFEGISPRSVFDQKTSLSRDEFAEQYLKTKLLLHRLLRAFHYQIITLANYQINSFAPVSIAATAQFILNAETGMIEMSFGLIAADGIQLNANKGWQAYCSQAKGDYGKDLKI